MELRADLVALAGLQGVALCATGLEEVGTLLGVACSNSSVPTTREANDDDDDEARVARRARGPTDGAGR